MKQNSGLKKLVPGRLWVPLTYRSMEGRLAENGLRTNDLPVTQSPREPGNNQQMHHREETESFQHCTRSGAGNEAVCWTSGQRPTMIQTNVVPHELRVVNGIYWIAPEWGASAQHTLRDGVIEL